ncbi:MAG: hypothetical protein PGN23_06790 [Sphingomonas adhaesiva]|uniref:hypothetical protein n=1 Tax=Sphingomonas adhaesiva TaxID=28212 RepID=UPI002FFCF3BC
MTDTSREEEPGFEADVNELPEGNQGPEDSLEDDALPQDEVADGDEAPEQAAEERKEGGYQQATTCGSVDAPPWRCH